MRVRRRVSQALDGAWSPPEPPSGLKLDLGCGAKKTPGTIGIDLEPAPGVDHVVDFTRERLPFDDDSVGSIFSSHCIEHLADPLPLFREMTRVAVDGARIELWTPYAWHDSAVFPDHVSAWTHTFYAQMSEHFPDVWIGRLGARWHVEEIVYVVTTTIQRSLVSRGIDLPFALTHLTNIVDEMGVYIRVDKSNDATPTPLRRTYAPSRDESQRRRHPIDAGPMASIPRQVARWIGRRR